jgi:hypothetical protein
MRVYSNPEVQKAVTGIQDAIIKADRIIADMRYTTELLGRRESDKNRTSLTAKQQAVLDANKGKHIYGSSHPLFVKES